MEVVDNAVAEPVVYMIERYVVGGFYRVHTERGRDENLNSPGHALRAARVLGQLQPAGLRDDGRGERGRIASTPMAWSRASPCSRPRSSSSAPRTGPNRCRRRWRPRSRADSGDVQDRSGMSLELLFVVDPLDELKAYKDSSVAMMREAARRGHAVYAATPDELAAATER